MPQTLAEMQIEYKTLTARVDEIFKEEDDAKIPAAMKQEVITANKRRDELEPLINEAVEMGGYRQKNDAAKSWLSQSTGNIRHGNGGTPVSGDVLSGDAANAQFRGGMSIGDAFVNNDTFKAWHGMVAPSGQEPSKNTQVQSPPIPIPNLSLKTLVTSNTTGTGVYTNTTGGALVQPQYLPMVALPFRPLKLRDVVTVIQAQSPIINYPKVTGYTNSAVEVAEATNTSSGTKPESALALALGTAVAATIAHFMPITRQALADATQLRDLIDAFLKNGLEQRLEDEMIGGDGTGANLTGVHNISGISTQANVTDNLTTLRKAITKAQTSPIFVEPSAYLLSPVDAEGLDLATDNESRFYFGGPASSNNGRLWNKPVIVSQAVPTGRAYTGDFSTLVLADLQEAQMYLFDQHSDWAVKNILALLAELRLLFFSLRPAAIIEITLGAW